MPSLHTNSDKHDDCREMEECYEQPEKDNNPGDVLLDSSSTGDNIIGKEANIHESSDDDSYSQFYSSSDEDKRP